jgi:PAT complex subunit CCDC47
VPFGRWWAIHERHALSEFKMEGAIIAISLVVFLIHLFGASLNRKKAKKWALAHAPVLRAEFASVGFEGRATPDVAPAAEKSIREKSLFEFSSYATGRQNVAFADIDLTLTKRFNPMISISETIISFFWDSAPAPRDFMDATIYPFDGKESLSVPSAPGAHELRSKDSKSTFDGFVWAIVAKERMKQTREDRYDLSLTFTKDNSKLPNWLSVMSESAEITDLLLTPEVIKAVEDAGDNFDYLIISDQPIVKPKT